MLAAALLIGIGLIAAVLVYAALKPKTFALSRSVVIAAPAQRIFALIDDLREFNRWNPFAAQDPDLKVEYNSVASGRGAAYTWIGKKSGSGRMEISDSVPKELVRMQLDFSKPMEAHNTVDFTLAPQAGQTKVTWTMTGAMSYSHNLMTTFSIWTRWSAASLRADLQRSRHLPRKPERLRPERYATVGLKSFATR